MSAGMFPEGVVTFWFTDIERSTALLQELGHDTYAGLLDQHNRILGDIVGSSLVSTEGDSFFCVFTSPLEAVSAAASAQRELEEYQWPDRGRVRVRVGMHTGQARRGGADYVGLDVHRAARISAAGHGGQVLLSDATRALVDHDLPDGVGLVDLGEHYLKDLRQPEHLFQLVIDGHQTSFPPLMTRRGGQVRLPEPASEFIGRDEEINEIGESLEKSRLVTLVGIGGVGKTRLALQTARISATDSGESVFFVALAELTEGGSVAKATADAISLSEQAGRPVEQTLVDYLSGRGDLLVFDNCELVVSDAATLVETLLRDCPQIRILATSREPLLIDGELVVPVEPMATEGAEQPGGQGDAVRLFVARARTASPGFDPEEWASEVQAICRRVDGIPLAIELAAARVSLLTPGEIVQHLEHRFDLLTSNRRGTEPRHQALESTLDWSYELLDPDVQTLLCRLSVFRGGFSLEAVEKVCYGDGSLQAQALDDLTALHERSLIQRNIVASGTRFRLLETVRDYAERKLAAHEGDVETVARHRSYFIDFVKTQTSRLSGSEQIESLDLLEHDHDNVREVLDRAVEAQDIDLASDLAGRMAWFWYVHGHFMEGERRAQDLLGREPSAADRGRLRLLIGSAQFDYRLGHYERASRKLEEAIEESIRTDARRLEMWARAYAATNAIYQMNVDESRRQTEIALPLAETEGDMLALGYLRMVQIGGAAVDLEARGALDAEEAVRLRAELEPMAQMAVVMGERNVVGHLKEVEGILSLRAGDPGGAADALDRSIVALTELGTVGCACHCLEAIAMCAAETGLIEDAVRLVGISDTLRESVGIWIAPMEEPVRSRAMELASVRRAPDEIAAIAESGAGASIPEAMQISRDVLARF